MRVTANKPSASIDSNPYAPSREPTTQTESLPDSAINRWRSYLIVHLVVVLATGAMSIADGAGYFHHNAFHEQVIPWGRFLGAFALVGIPLAYTSPVVIILLLVRAGKLGPKYAVAAAVETILMAVHFYAMLPLVQ